MSRKLIRRSLLLLVMRVAIALCPVGFSQTLSSPSGSITGLVKDTTGAALQGAKVVLAPTSTSAATDAEGEFAIEDVRPGTYTVTISYVGFGTSVMTAVVLPGLPTILNTTLRVGDNSQQVEVTASQDGDLASINEQRTSENILNVLSDAEIQSLPNQNVADALGRLPGVTLQRNEGEGQYVQIRGTEPRLSNTTIDGVIEPGPDPQVRQVDLDTIPADLVGSVAINKTLSANQDGDAIGGSVDLRIKQATSDTPTFSITGMGGNTPIDNNRQVFSIASSTGFRLGSRNDAGVKKLGLELGYSYDSNSRGIDDVEPVPDLDSNGGKTFDAIYLQQYLYDRTRYGFAGSLDYNMSPGTDLYAHGLFSNFRDYGEKYAYQLKAAPRGRTTPVSVGPTCRLLTSRWAPFTCLSTPTSSTRSPARTPGLAGPLEILAPVSKEPRPRTTAPTLLPPLPSTGRSSTARWLETRRSTLPTTSSKQSMSPVARRPNSTFRET